MALEQFLTKYSKYFVAKEQTSGTYYTPLKNLLIVEPDYNLAVSEIYTNTNGVMRVCYFVEMYNEDLSSVDDFDVYVKHP